jgi:hypothetical protein
LIRDDAKAALGTYEYKWPRLAESTQADRVKKGFPEDEPGLRTGDMRASIEAKIFADERRAFVGSNSDKLVWFELGTKSQPPRPVLMGAAVHNSKEILKLSKKNIRTAWLSARYGNHELMEALHLLRLLLDAAHDVVKGLQGKK